MGNSPKESIDTSVLTLIYNIIIDPQATIFYSADHEMRSNSFPS